MLKMAVLVPQVRRIIKSPETGDAEIGRVTKSQLIQAIANLSRNMRVPLDAQEPLLSAAGLRFEHVKTKDPKSRYSTPLYCEHPMLSLQHPGDVVKMLKVVDPTKLKTMSRDTLQDFLDAAVCSLGVLRLSAVHGA